MTILTASFNWRSHIQSDAEHGMEEMAGSPVAMHAICMLAIICLTAETDLAKSERLPPINESSASTQTSSHPVSVLLLSC